MKEETKKFIIIDNRTSKALYGLGVKTLNFKTEDIALAVAVQFFERLSDFIIVEIDFGV